jgi:thymidylate kinase
LISTLPTLERTEQYHALSDGDYLASTLTAVKQLMDVLKEMGIRYCHWKSNSRLDLSLAGLTDLDLLVDPANRTRFEQILSSQNIKNIVAPKDKQYPGLEHYLGFDHESGKLFHLHVHYKLILGEQFVKNYHVPIEDYILNNTQEKFGVRIPKPEIELVLLSIRALLKYRDRDVIKDIFNIRHPGIPEHILQELLWLLEQTTITEAEKTLQELSIFSNAEWINEFLEIVQQDHRKGWRLFQLRSRIRKELNRYKRHNRVISTFKYFKSLIDSTTWFGVRKDNRMRFPGGGKLIALVGIDGSGKSTLSAAVTDWLRWKISTPLYYLGSKQPSLLSEISYLIFRMFRRSHTILTNWIGGNNFLAKILVTIRSFFLATHFLFVGKDRDQRYRMGKKISETGSVVIFDRFPFFSPLDGPEIRIRLENNFGFASRMLANLEEKLYRNFNFLDLLLILNVSPEVCVVRKPDHSLETIHSKYDAINRLKAELKTENEKYNWINIDSNVPLANVLLEIKREIWKIL